MGQVQESETLMPSLNERDFAATRGAAVLEWSCRVRESKAKHLLPFRLCIFFAGLFAFSISLYQYVFVVPADSNFMLFFFGPVMFFLFLFSMGIEQKTVYNYALSARRGGCESYHYFPAWAGVLFKGIAIVVVVVVFAMVIIFGSLVPLLGAGALGLGYIGQLATWKNKVSYEVGVQWDEYKFVTLDYGRRMIVVHGSDITMGLELRCQNQAQFEECWGFLRTALIPDIEVMMRNWDAHDAYHLNI